MSTLPTFSKIALADACLASALLPKVHDASGPAAQRGSALHAYGANAQKVGKAAALKLVSSEYRDDCEALDLDAIDAFLGPGERRREAAYAYQPDLDTCRLLGIDIGRQYAERGGDMAEEFCGALDYECIREGELVVVDLKTGRGAVDTWQLRAQAVAASRFHGIDCVTIAFARADETGAVRFEAVDTLDAFDLDMIAGELRQLKARIKRGVLEYAPSADNCRWCRSVPWCQAQTGLVRALVGDVAVPEPSELTPAKAGESWERLIAAERLLARVRESLETYATQTPFPTPSGGIVQAVESGRDYVSDPLVIANVVRAKYGDEAAKAIIEPSTSKMLIAKTLRGKAGTRDLEVLYEMAKRQGGFVSKTTTKVQEVTVPKALRAMK